MKKIMKKCFFAVMLICLSLFLETEIKAAESKEITEVKLELTEEAGGIRFEDYKNELKILSEGLTIPTQEQAPLGWFSIKCNSTESSSSVIEVGKRYDLNIYLLPAEGYVLPSSISDSFVCTMNGSDSLTKCSLNGEFILVTIKNFEAIEYLKSLDITVEDLLNYEVGLVIDDEWNIVMDKITYFEISYSSSTQHNKYPYTIEPHANFYISIGLRSQGGYYVDKLDWKTIRLNGIQAYEYRKLGGAYYASFKFDNLHGGGEANCHSPKICDTCNKKYGEKNPDNHDGETVLKNQIPATCMTIGYSGDVYCNSCDECISKGTLIPVLEEHTYDAGVITTSPTETSTGVKTYTCVVCKRAKTEVLPKLESAEKPKEEVSQGNTNKEETSKDNTVKEDASAKEDAPGDTAVKGDAPAINTELTESKTGMKYRVSKAGESGGSVEFLAPANKKIKQITIPETVKIGGISYKVTSIAKNAFKGCKSLKKVVIGKNITKIGSKAFYGCKNLKTITIKTTKLKSSKVGKKAFTGTSKKAQVTVPKKSYKAYKKFLYKKGIYKKAKIKKAK